ncbi:MAG TPA: AAA family ATPase [Gammaproteobacteria bacterium]|nr:AAA family ATPase [Chromatiales bacterium]HOP15817.1 AAA family ATPase [Gammaproteobacteria bacterium]HPQ25729.1 AAA family ATPase [Gammaproteobacteria bacterium]
MYRRWLKPFVGALTATDLDLDASGLPDGIHQLLGGLSDRHDVTSPPARLYGPNPWRGSQLLFVGGAAAERLLAAQLLARDLDTRVWQIPSTALIGRYIGETEKNIGKVFDLGARSGWILFFDEADALFGKRTNVKDAHDRYANLEVSHLLQCAEDFRGLVILSLSSRPYLTAAVQRQFEAQVSFVPPVPGDRD